MRSLRVSNSSHTEVWTCCERVGCRTVLKWALSGSLPLREYTTCLDVAGSGAIKWRKVDIRRIISGACFVSRDVVEGAGTKHRGTDR